MKNKSIMGRERALIDGLTNGLQAVISGPPPSKKTVADVRRHKSARPFQTLLGNAFDVQIVDPDGNVTGHIARVTVELDRFEEALVSDRDINLRSSRPRPVKTTADESGCLCSPEQRASGGFTSRCPVHGPVYSLHGD